MTDKVVFICKNCRFRFERKPDWKHPLCPNCSKEDCCEREDTINKFIKDVL